MNSYNENLNSTVVASLQAQELEQSTMKAQLNAAMFTLYYAEGAKITAQEKLDAITKTYTFQREVKESAINNNTIAVNLLASANQEKQYVSQSATNTAVAAANVQVAANAIVRLASDMGSILSILSAADFGSHTYKDALEVKALIDDTAYNAEMTSQLAMDAAYLTAEVSASTVADIAKATTAAVTNLLTVVSNQFDSTAASVAADNVAFANAFVDEKKAEGILEDINVEYYASKEASWLAVDEMNLNLHVKPSTKNGADYKYTVCFEAYLNPFFYSEGSDDSMEKYHLSPVKDYFILLVKERNVNTFSIAIAEKLKPNQYIKFQHPIINNHKSSLKITKDIFMTDFMDSDGEPMKMGENYVVFVMAQFNEEYKRALNNFDDFLTAPSAPFSLTNHLSSPKSSSISVNNSNTLSFNVAQEADFKVEYRCMFLPDNSHLVKGLLTESGLRKIENEVEKRELIAEKYDPEILKDEADIVSLNSAIDSINDKINPINILINTLDAELKVATPAHKDAIIKKIKVLNEKLTPLKIQLDENTTDLIDINKNLNNLLKEKAAELLKIEVKTQELTDHKYDPKILKDQEDIVLLESSIISLNAEIIQSENKLAVLKEDYKKNPNTSLKNKIKSLSGEIFVHKNQLEKVEIKLIKANIDLDKLYSEKEAELLKLTRNKPGFFFNLLLAQEVPAGNYFKANPSNSEIFPPGYIVQIKDNTTDNFGNPLIKGKTYVPVILSVAAVQEENANQYTNSLSQYQDTASFIYN